MLAPLITLGVFVVLGGLAWIFVPKWYRRRDLINHLYTSLQSYYSSQEAFEPVDWDLLKRGLRGKGGFFVDLLARSRQSVVRARKEQLVDELIREVARLVRDATPRGDGRKLAATKCFFEHAQRLIFVFFDEKFFGYSEGGERAAAMCERMLERMRQRRREQHVQ